MKVITNKIILKNYIYYLLKILSVTNNVDELEELLILYNSLFIENKTKHVVFKNKLKIFLVKFKKIKLLLSDKSDIILYNKLYKILIELNKLTKNNDVNSLINLSLEEIKEKNLFMFLPFKLDVIFIFRKK